jgi:hypothetical protein
MGIDVAYQTPEGWVLRQLLTDDEIRRVEHLRLYAAATALHLKGVWTAAKSRASRCGPCVLTDVWRAGQDPCLAA